MDVEESNAVGVVKGECRSRCSGMSDCVRHHGSDGCLTSLPMYMDIEMTVQSGESSV